MGPLLKNLAPPCIEKGAKDADIEEQDKCSGISEGGSTGTEKCSNLEIKSEIDDTELKECLDLIPSIEITNADESLFLKIKKEDDSEIEGLTPGLDLKPNMELTNTEECLILKTKTEDYIEIEVPNTEEYLKLKKEQEDDSENEVTGTVAEEGTYVRWPYPAPSTSPSLENALRHYAQHSDNISSLHVAVSSHITFEASNSSTALGVPDIGDQIQSNEISITKSTEKILPVKILPLRNLRCDPCNGTFAIKDKLVTNLLSHEGKTVIIKCKTCNRTFRYLESLRKHMIAHHPLPEPNSTCHICSKDCRGPNLLKIHLKAHEKRSCTHPWECSICGKTYKSEDSLRRHRRSHNQSSSSSHEVIYVKRLRNCEKSKKKYKCDMCPSSLSSGESLRRHKQMHSDDIEITLDDLTCPVCSLLCLSPNLLKRHLRLHEKYSGTKVCELCGTVCENEVILKAHLETHNQHERYFSCEHCGKKFLRKEDLHVHHRVHTHRKLICDYCGFSTNGKNNLTRHIKTHL